MTPQVKICGLTTAAGVAAASGADYLGFIFFPASPRNLMPAQAAGLAKGVSQPTVAVMVDPDDTLLDTIFAEFKPHYIQLHGNESPARVAQIKSAFKTPVIKAFKIRTGDDVAKAHAYEKAADMLMFDAKAPEGLPGGNGLSFDWKLLAGRSFGRPWFLSGGLNADNVEEALRISGAAMVDVSSSVESEPGVKDPALVRGFIEQVKRIRL